MARLAKTVAVVLAAVALAGCAKAGNPYSPARAAAPSTLSNQNPYGQMPGGQLGPNGQPLLGAVQPGVGGQAGGAAEGTALLNAMRQQFATCSGFDATISNYSQGNFKEGKRVNELRKSTTEARLIWVKPMKIRGEVIKTTNSLLEGAAMATSDGTNIRVRLKGLLGLLPISVKATDPKLSNNRNHSFLASNPDAQIKRLTAATAVWTVVGQETVEGAACKVIRISGVGRADAEVTDELLWLEPTTMVLRRLAMTSGQTKLMEANFKKFVWNPTVPASSFTL